MQQSDGESMPFSLNEDGTVTINAAPEVEMDIAAEQFAREILTTKN